MNSFVQANPLRCIGCRTCAIACVVSHEGKRIFEIDPDSVGFSPKLFMTKTARVSAPVQCRHCENPACKQSCTSGAISIVDEGGVGSTVVINRAKCIGCKNCMTACPFGAVEIVETAEVANDGSCKKTASKCDLCIGVADSPSCVRVCPTEALKLTTENDMTDAIRAKRAAAVGATV